MKMSFYVCMAVILFTPTTISTSKFVNYYESENCVKRKRKYYIT